MPVFILVVKPSRVSGRSLHHGHKPVLYLFLARKRENLVLLAAVPVNGNAFATQGIGQIVDFSTSSTVASRGRLTVLETALSVYF